MSYEIVRTGTGTSTHPGRDIADAVKRAQAQMDDALDQMRRDWIRTRTHTAKRAGITRAHVVALSCTTSVDGEFPHAHIVYSYELQWYPHESNNAPGPAADAVEALHRETGRSI